METIFTKDKSGRDRFLDIRVEEIDGCWCILKTTGIVGGKESISTTQVPLGYESATKRAKTMWKNQKTKATAILPMLANKWDDRKKYISTPFYVQPKLDGIRLLVSNEGCFSRTGKPVKGVDHLSQSLKPGEYLDGECYAPNKTFEEITSMFKMNPEDLEFHIFDYFDINKPDLTFEERIEKINIPRRGCHVVNTKSVNNKSDVSKLHDKFVKMGYEGIMIRDRKSIYEVGARSNYLLKFKTFQTEEYEIIGAKTGHGRDANAVVWLCKTEDGNEFTARPEGTIENREYMYTNRDVYIGKMLTVRFQNLTDIGVPRFPVGVAIRDYE
jgi:DNA ligase-1